MVAWLHRFGAGYVCESELVAIPISSLEEVFEENLAVLAMEDCN